MIVKLTLNTDRFIMRSLVFVRNDQTNIWPSGHTVGLPWTWSPYTLENTKATYGWCQGGDYMAGALARSRWRSGGLALRCGHNFLPRDDAWRGGLSNRFRGALDVKEAGLVFWAELVLQPVLGYLDFGRDQPVALGGEVFCWPCCRGWASPADKLGDRTSMRDVGLAAGGQGQEGQSSSSR